MFLFFFFLLFFFVNASAIIRVVFAFDLHGTRLAYRESVETITMSTVTRNFVNNERRKNGCNWENDIERVVRL